MCQLEMPEGLQILTEQSTVVSRWREFFSDVLNCRTIAREEALASINQYPLQEDTANSPTLEEILAAIKLIKSGKTPGPAEVYTIMEAQLFMPNC